MNDSNPAASQPVAYTARERTTALASRGEPMVWLTGGALAVCAIMVVALLGLVVWGGSRTFWPRPIVTVSVVDENGALQPPFLAMVVRDESYDPSPAERSAIDAARAKEPLPAGSIDEQGRPVRRLFRVGNRDFSGQPFVWHPLWRVKSQTIDPQATLLERQEWGVWLGSPTAIVKQSTVTLKPGEPLPAATEGSGDGRVERQVIAASADSPATVTERRTWDSSPAAVTEKLREVHQAQRSIALSISELKDHQMGAINRRIEAERLAVKKAEIEYARSQREGTQSFLPASLGTARPLIVGSVIAVSVLAAAMFVIRLRQSRPIEPGFLPPPQPRRVTINILLLVATVLGAIFAYTENPWRGPAIDLPGLEDARSAAAAIVKTLNEQYDLVRRQAELLEAQDSQWRVVFTDPSSGRFAPQRPTEAQLPIRVSQIVRAVQPNQLGLWGKVGVYFDRWGEFLFSHPRDANMEGGILPVIIGTVTLTILLSVVVVPLGVIAALYLREYARQGPLTSAIRIAINNLAGVPSIVYGVFGLGFFCYTLGAFIDVGPGVNPGAAVSFGPITGRAVALWWLGALCLGGVVVGAVLVGLAAQPVPGKQQARTQRWLGNTAFGLWIAAAAGAIALIATTPYFNGFFEAKSVTGGGSTLAAKGMLWSAITLALLTLPVVIVATEEAIAAVPRTMREASLGCGATRWQTIQRVVLPRAMPGIMTGAILAMARGAGEVAPLMLVGAVKKVDESPVDAEFPFIHLERPFMHLGFHIYDVGFQSPDSEAARPLVWCITLLLILVVVALNATAIRVRTGLRKKFLGEAF